MRKREFMRSGGKQTEMNENREFKLYHKATRRSVASVERGEKEAQVKHLDREGIFF